MIPLTEDEKKRQLALGYGWGKRIPSSSDGVIRWLDNTETIEFVKPVFNASYTNVEFEINNNPHHKIWLSQLQGVFMNDNKMGELYCGVIQLKDNTQKLIREFSSEEFCEFVKGKKFRVSVDEKAKLLIDERNDRVKTLLITHKNYFKVLDYIFEKLETKQYDLITGMTKAGRCYDLIEV